MLSYFDWLPESLVFEFHSYWTVALVNLVLLVIAYPIALIRGRNDKDLRNLTVWTMRVESKNRMATLN